MRTKVLSGLFGAWIGVSGVYVQDLGPRPQFIKPDFVNVQLGQLLFYDSILSGN